MTHHIFRKKFLIFFLILLSFSSSAQPVVDSLEHFLKSINFTGPLSGKYYSTKFITLPEELKCEPSDQNYLWLKKHLIIQIDGSGKIYSLDSSHKQFIRQDKTCYEGYNFGAFNFIHNDSLFSLGGYGFWTFNGMLRYYDEKNGQWSILANNKTLPLMRSKASVAYYDQIDKKVYVIYRKQRQLNEDESVQIDQTIYVQCIDLITKKWWEEPRPLNISKLNSLDDLLHSSSFHTKQGLLSVYENDIILLDFKNNKIVEIQKDAKAVIYNKLFTRTEWLLFTSNNYLFFYDPNANKADSISFLESNLITTNIPLYKSKEITNNTNITIPYWVLILSICMLSIIIGLLLKIFSKRSASVLNTNSELKDQLETIIKNTNSFKENLSNSEMILLNLIIENAQKNVMTSVGNINHALGIAQKPLKIQNNIRAINILMVNKKFMVFSACNDELILKERTEFDKRIFEYTIQKKYLHKVI